MALRTLSLCIMARKPAPRVRAILEQFRPVVDEIVLAADRTGDPAILEQCADLADKRFALDPAPLNRRLGWLHAQCDGDWILRFDDDEAPSHRRGPRPDGGRVRCHEPWWGRAHRLHRQVDAVLRQGRRSRDRPAGRAGRAQMGRHADHGGDGPGKQRGG